MPDSHQQITKKLPAVGALKHHRVIRAALRIGAHFSWTGMLGNRVSDRTEMEGDKDFPLDDVERTRWFMHHILPHEAALRGWLSRRRAPGAFDVDDIVQESYALLAERERVDDILNPRAYLFQVAHSLVRSEAFAGRGSCPSSRSKTSGWWTCPTMRPRRNKAPSRTMIYADWRKSSRACRGRHARLLSCAGCEACLSGKSLRAWDFQKTQSRSTSFGDFAGWEIGSPVAETHPPKPLIS